MPDTIKLKGTYRHHVSPPCAHDLEDGALASNAYTISQKRRRRLDARYVGGGGLSTRELGRAP